MPLTILSTGSQGLTAVGFQQVTVSSTALALVIPDGITPRRVAMTIQTGAIRFRYDGGDPTTSMGHKTSAPGTGGNELEATGALLGAARILRFRMIRDGSTDAEVAYTIEV